MTIAFRAAAASNGRIEWLDLLKGMGIILVVLGHTYSPFGVWIYSFHMPLFFFTSALALKVSRETDLMDYFLKRIRTLLVPFFCFSLFLIAVGKILGMFQVEFGCSGSVHELFMHLSTPQNAGATWFLVVLAEASLLFAFFKKFLGSRSLIFSTSAMALAIYLYKNKLHLPWLFDLALFAWFFMDLTFLLKPFFLDFEPRRPRCIALLILSLASTYVLCVVHWARMNWPTRDFDKIILLNVIAAFAGIYTLAFLAKCVEKISAKRLNALVWLGQNSIGILMFHFIGFKVGFLFSGDSNYSKLVPEAGDFWLLYLVYGTGVSVILTLIFSQVRVTRSLLLGKN